MKSTFATFAAATAALLVCSSVSAGVHRAGNALDRAAVHGSTGLNAASLPGAPVHATGQPNASCEETPNTPGNAAFAPGSAFNPDGKAGSVYAGEQPQNSRNPNSVSQYDAACSHQR